MALSPANIILPIPVVNPNPVVPDSKEFWHHRMHCQSVFQSLFSYWNPDTSAWMKTPGLGANGQYFTPYHNTVYPFSITGLGAPLLDVLEEEKVLSDGEKVKGNWDLTPGKSCIQSNHHSLMHYDTAFWIMGAGQPYITTMAEIMLGKTRLTDIVSQAHPKTSGIPTDECNTCKDVSGSFSVATIVDAGMTQGDWIDVVNTTPSNSLFMYKHGGLMKVEYPPNYAIPEFDLKRNYWRSNGSQIPYLGQFGNGSITHNGLQFATQSSEHHKWPGTGSAYSSSANGWFSSPNESNNYEIVAGTQFAVTGLAPSASDMAISTNQWRLNQKMNMPIWYITNGTSGCNEPMVFPTNYISTGQVSKSAQQVNYESPDVQIIGHNQTARAAKPNYNGHKMLGMRDFGGALGASNNSVLYGWPWSYTSSYGEELTFVGVRYDVWGGWNTPYPAGGLAQGTPAKTYYFPCATSSDDTDSVYYKFPTFISCASLSYALNKYAEYGTYETHSNNRMYIGAPWTWSMAESFSTAESDASGQWAVRT